MYPASVGAVVWILSFVNLVWVIIITFVIWKNQKFYQKIFPKLGSKQDNSPVMVLDRLLKEVESWREYKDGSLGFVNRVALKRYNPYKDTGGDQSFSVAFLNGKLDGVIITSLHSRAGTRVFAKSVKMGREDKSKLSEEESQVLKEALNKL